MSKEIHRTHCRLGCGAFWVVGVEGGIEWLPYILPCDANGTLTEQARASLTFGAMAKALDNFNHRLLWNTLPRNVTQGHSYRFYPRGRVEVKNGRATVYLNPHIHTEEMLKQVRGTFGLNRKNGIATISVRADGSAHYQCHLDDDTIP